MCQSVDPQLSRDLRAYLEQRSEIDELYNLITLQLGNDVMVSIKARMRGEDSAIGLIDQINSIEKELKQRFPVVRFSFFEPDVDDADEPTSARSL